MPLNNLGLGTAFITSFRFIGLSILGLGTALYTLARRHNIPLSWFHLRPRPSTTAVHTGSQTELQNLPGYHEDSGSTPKRDTDAQTLRTELSTLHAELARLTHELEERNRAWIEQQMEAVQAENKIHDLECILRNTEGREGDLKDEFRGVCEERDGLRKECEALKMRARDMTVAGESQAQAQAQREREKGKGKTSMNRQQMMKDDVEVEDIIEMLRVLNVSIRQVSSSVVELFPSGPHSHMMHNSAYSPLSDSPTSPTAISPSSLSSSTSSSSVELAPPGAAYTSSIEQSEEFSHLSEIFGPKITSLLLNSSLLTSSSPSNYDPRLNHDGPSNYKKIAGGNNNNTSSGLIQSIIQAYIGVYTVWMIASWHLEPLGDENILAELYESMLDTEPQSISGPWRATTRKHIDKILPHTSSASSLSEHFIQASINVLCVSGRIPSIIPLSFLDPYSPNSDPTQYDGELILDLQHGDGDGDSDEDHPPPPPPKDGNGKRVFNRTQIHDRIKTHLGPQIEDMTRQVFKVKRAIGQGMRSAEIEVVSVPEEQPYDRHTMDVDSERLWLSVGEDDEVRKNGDGEEQEIVMLTTELGLRRSYTRDHDDTNGGVVEDDGIEVLLKPRVVLERDLDRLVI